MRRQLTAALLGVALVAMLGCDQTGTTFNPPSPDSKAGPIFGIIGEDQEFTVTATDARELDIACRFDWGDGQVSDWSSYVPSGLPLSAEHNWGDEGEYAVRAQLRNAHEDTTDWLPVRHIALHDGPFRYPDTVVAVLDAGSDPVGIACSPNGQYVYVAARGDDQLTVIRTADNEVVDRIDVGSRPHAVCVLPNGRYAYVANCAGADVSVVDLSDNTVVATVPVGGFPIYCAPAPNSRHVYVTNYSSGTLSVIDTDDNTVAATIDIEPYCWGIAVSPNGHHVYVGGSNGPRVYVVDAETYEVLRTFDVHVAPEGLCLSPGGHYLYAACRTSGSGSVDVVYAVDYTEVVNYPASVTVDGYPVVTAVTPSGRYVYVTSHEGATIRVIDCMTNEVVWRVDGARGACYMTILPNGHSAYVCCNYEGHVWVLGTK